MKLSVSKISFVVTLAISLALMVAGFIVPPTGVIDPSVLTGVGELLGFAVVGQVPALARRGTDFKVTRGNTSIEINNPDTQTTTNHEEK